MKMLSETGLHVASDGKLKSFDIKGTDGKLYQKGREWDAAVKWSNDVIILRNVIRNYMQQHQNK